MIAAHADSPDPVLPFHASVSFDGAGNPVLTLDGGWAWTTHKSDCNTNRYAVGYAVDWNDSSAPGNLVGTVNAQTVNVGTPTDNNVHYVHLASDPNPNNDPVGATRCGTFNAGLGYNTGNWGPISHTYPKGTTTFQTCLVTYDMHLGPKNVGLKAGDDIAGGAGHNTDNSVQGNKNTPLGNQCFTFFIPAITTSSAPATVNTGDNFADTATLSGYDPNNLPPTGSITFTLHSALGGDPNGCGATVGSAMTVPVSKLSSGPDVYGAVSPNVNEGSAGTYYWQASYSGDSHNAAVDGKCSDANESTQVNAVAGSPGISTTAVTGVTVGATISDQAVLSNYDPTLGTGSITFTLYSSTTGAGNGCGTQVTAYTADVEPVTNIGTVASPVYGANSAPFTTTAAGNYFWLASYSGDRLNKPVDGHCTDNGETSAVNAVVPPPPPPPAPTGTLSITKAVDKATANYGDTLTYTLDVSASGTLDETNVLVKDYIPGYDPAQPASGPTTYVAGSASCSGSGTCTTSYDATKHQVSWNIGTLVHGTSRDVSFQVTIDTPAAAADGSIPPEVIYNAATVSSTENPTDTLSNVVQTQVAAVPPLPGSVSVTKAVDKANANYGDTLTYTLHVAQSGGASQTDVVVSDFVPGYDPAEPNSGKTTYVSGSAACVGPGTCTTSYDASQHEITWDLGTMATGATRDVTFEVTVDTPTPDANGGIPQERIDNVASVTSAENPDASPSNVVHTVIGAVLGENRQQRTPATLPFTGIPVADMNWLGATLLIAGGGMQGVRRRRSRRRRG